MFIMGPGSQVSLITPHNLKNLPPKVNVISGTDFFVYMVSSKVICAFLESQDENVSILAIKELQPLLESGTLKRPENKQAANET